MTPEELFSRLRQQALPEGEARDRIKARMMKRVSGEHVRPLFVTLKESIHPENHVKHSVWSRVSEHLLEPSGEMLESVRTTLTPTRTLREALKTRILFRMGSTRVSRFELVPSFLYGPRALKWAAAFVLFGLLVRVSPLLFMASPTVAETEAILLPTRGNVSVALSGLWQPVTGQLTLEPGMMLRTYDGEASVVLHDDGVIRLDRNTTISLHDIADRLEPGLATSPTATLYTGRIWVQGLVPSLRGIRIATSYGDVTINEGSVSIAEDDVVDIEVYDRRAVVTRSDTEKFLAVGERTRIQEESSALLVKKMSNRFFREAWADQNLQRDAVHRHEIAQLQHERHVAKAGILPTSPLYAMKRFAEAVDILLTFGEEERVQKKLQVAETRLSEAAALISEGEEAELVLNEYRTMLEEVAHGERTESIADLLVRRALAESTAQLAASLPGDASYVLKKTILETGADLPDEIVRQEEIEGILLLDNLASLTERVDAGETDAARTVWSDLQPYLLTLDSEDVALDPAVRKEATILLSFLASSLHDASARGAEIDPELLEDVAEFLPKTLKTDVALSEEEIMEMVQRIRSNIFVYHYTRPRINQFIVEMKALANHPDQGRILRRLAMVLPDGPEHFPDRVTKEIVKLRWARAAQGVI